MDKEENDVTKKKEKKEEKKQFCPECGNSIDKDDKYCENCGKKIASTKEDNSDNSMANFDDNEDHVINNFLDDDSDKENNFFKNELKKESVSSKSKKMNKKDFSSKLKDNNFVIAAVSSCITLLICIIFTIIYCNNFMNTSSTVETVNKDVTITDTGIAEAVSKVYDSVVVVKTYVKGELYSTGTGFVYKKDDKNGYILTNNHVIEEGTELKVVFTDQTETTATLVGTDEYSDIALLKVDKDKVKAVAEVGSSDDMKVGDTTFAVGAPLDSTVYSWTVTRGILSGKNRLVETTTGSSTFGSSSSNVMEVLQTDTAINSGNSGGPLCNANGEVIGITNMKIASSSVEGMGFAIPIETAVEYAEKFINGEAIVRPYLGISMYDMSNSMLSTTTGIYVAAVESGSPADKAGFKKGDIITKIGDTKVDSSSYLKYELYKYDIDDKVTFTYTRNNKEYTTDVTLGSTN